MSEYYPDLPQEFSNEYKTKFEVKELAVGGEPERVPQSPSLNEEKKKRGPAKRRKKKKEDLAQALPPSFVIPNRRPAKDPIWIGERLVYSISYFGIHAGEFTLEVLPYKTVGDRKSYHFHGSAVTAAVFNVFYRINDQVESFTDYNGLFSHRFRVILDETKQQRDALELNDAEKKQTFYWNRWKPADGEYRETKEYGTVPEFSQDSLSALYFLRTIDLPIGSVVTFPVISEGKYWEAICNIVRREERDTPFGEVPTIVIQPDTKFQGVLRKNGDSFLWLTDDERRFPVRLEAKVKIGTVVANLVRVERGSPSQ